MSQGVAMPHFSSSANAIAIAHEQQHIAEEHERRAREARQRGDQELSRRESRSASAMRRRADEALRAAKNLKDAGR
jgi:hypothetical protein